MKFLQFIIIATLFLVGCNKEPRFYVEGHVLREGSGEKVARGRVDLFESDCFLGCSEHLVASGTTDPSGFFRIVLEETSSMMSLVASSSRHFPGDRVSVVFDDGKAVADCSVIPKAWVRYVFTGKDQFSFAFLHTNRRDLNHPQQLGTFLSTGQVDTTNWMEIYGSVQSEIGVYVTNSQGAPDSSYQWPVVVTAFDSLTMLAPF